MRVSKKITALLIVLVITVTACFVPAFSMPDHDDGRIEIVVKQGEDSISINGETVKAEKPFVRDGTLYVPLRLVLETIGAEVNWLGNGRINIVYRDVEIDLTVGEKKCIVNQAERELAAPVVFSNGTAMIPVDLLEEYFKTKVTTDNGTGTAYIVLEEDGALEDLLFLIGGISKPRAGNSYFKWRMEVPKGSRIVNSTFNSKYITIENEQRQILIEISVYPDEGKSLEEQLDKIESYSVGSYGKNNLESSIESDGKKKYIELLYGNEYDEAVCQRIYRDNGYFYEVTLILYSEADPAKIKGNKYLKGILDSFDTGYTAPQADVQDLSKVRYGLARYANYISTYDGKKYPVWEMNVLPEWDVLEYNYENPFLTEIGLGKSEYVSVEVVKPKKDESAAEYAKKVEKQYADNFNPKYYNLIEKKELTVGGYKAYNLVFSITMGNKKYTVDESFLSSGGIIYDITVKTPEDKYEKAKQNYYRMLDTFKILVKDVGKISSEIEKYKYNEERNRVAKTDRITEYVNKTYGWKLKIPGYWIKGSQTDASFQSFTNRQSGAAIVIEASENTEGIQKLSDEMRFFFMGSVAIRNDVKLIKKEDIVVNGRTARHYLYRVENNEEESYYDMDFYVLDTDKYSYCFMSSLPDLCASEKNLKEIRDIWESFSIITPEKKE